MSGIDPAAAARFGLMLDAVRRGNRALAAEMLLSIPESDLAAMEDRLARYGLNLLNVLAVSAGSS